MAYILLISTNHLFRAYLGAELIELGHRVDGLDSIQEAAAKLPQMSLSPKLTVIKAAGQTFDEPSISKLAQASTLLVCAGAYDMAQTNFEQLGIRNIAKKPLSIGELVDQISKLLREKNSVRSVEKQAK